VRARTIPAFLLVLLPLAGSAQSIVWQTEIAGQQRTVEIVDTVLQVVPPKNAAPQWRPGRVTALGTVTAAERTGVVVTLAPGKSVRDGVEAALAAGAIEAAPVFVEKGKARRGNAAKARRYLLTHKVLIAANDEAAARNAANIAGARRFDPTIAPGMWMLTFANAREVLDAYPRLQSAGIKAQPQFKVPVFKKAASNDPLYPRQWHLKNTGQGAGSADVDVSVEPVWDAGIRGAGQVIAIVDDGLQLQHPDLAPNAMPLGGDFGSSFHWNFNATPQNNNPADLNRGEEPDSHGTNCAGVAAARGNNGIGVSGAAPEAKLIGLRLIVGDIVDENAAAALNWRTNIVSVSSNSWGYDDDNSVTTSGPDPLARAALERAAAEGRNGRGTIFTVAGGNGGTPDYAGFGPGVDESNYDGFANSPFTIAVGGNNDKGFHNFAETGCNLVVTAPTGGEGNDQDITTTTLTGLGDIPGFADYTAGFNGTSSATPLVSGVIALMLNANPSLGWRDVQEILIRSSRKIDNGDVSWQTNGAGLPFRFSNRYGAGMANAQAAVDLSKTWSNLPPQITVTRESGGAPIPIPDNSEFGAQRSFDFSGTNLRVEQVQFTVDVSHPYRGDLEFVLTAPSGMQSVVNRRSNDDTSDLQWTFLSVQHWGEQSNGTWTVKARDRAAQDIGAFNFASLRIFGAAPVAPTPTRLGNIATRLRVGTGAEALIGGIIITGNQPKRVIVRAIGPSSGVPGALGNPQLELNNASGEVLRTNDNWQDAPNRDEIIASTVAPPDDLESAVLMTLDPGQYTAVVRGVNGETGIGVVEAYDLDGTATSRFGNIATRGMVQAGDNVMIGGFIVLGSAPQKVIVRAIGPSLPLEGKLTDPKLDLVDGNGNVVRGNNNWKESQQSEIEATGIPPENDLESAIVTFVPPGAYTALVAGENATTGIAVVEVYALQ
jgi:subtilisin-like proprotein convertase family protein